MSNFHWRKNPSDPIPEAIEPRWPALIAALATGGLYLALPASLSIGPRWLPLVCVSLLLVPIGLSYRYLGRKANVFLGHVLSALLTAFMIGSLALLVRGMIEGKEQPAVMLRSAVALWLTNVLVFSLWYWRLDAGGPHAREMRAGHTDGAFLFPQMMMPEDLKKETGESNWSPNYWDYLFLAFNTSAALSPTDTMILSRWAKLLMMIQALIALTVVALLAARAVNVIGS